MLMFASMIGFIAVLIFLPAGRLDWPLGWICLAVTAILLMINYLYLIRRNPALIAQRMKVGWGTKTWDRIWSASFAPAFIALYVVSGLDAVRYGWTSMPAGYWLLGIALFVPAMLMFTWSMGENPFFEKTVRIQTERGHRVIDTGPYRIVRHPGYVGFIGWMLATPFLLGSWWALAPALVAVAGILVRTALEDRTLKAELTGYAEYTERTRFRLIPGVW